MNAFTLLKTDHKKVAQLFKKIEAASSGTKKAELFSELKSELDVHANVEEKLLYPALENKEVSREITLEAYEEHNVVKDLLGELATQAPNDEWDAKLTVLKENVEHHVEEEEGELFTKARKVLSKDQIERLGAEMEAAKAQMNGGPPAPGSDKNREAPANEARSKSGDAETEAQSPGVLKRLASFVGLGGESAAAAEKTGARKAAGKTGSAKKASSSKKTVSQKGTKKAAAKTASRSGAKKSVKRQAATKKAARKTAARPAKKAAKKSAAKKK